MSSTRTGGPTGVEASSALPGSHSVVRRCHPRTVRSFATVSAQQITFALRSTSRPLYAVYFTAVTKTH
jgi:hypothetical protein